MPERQTSSIARTIAAGVAVACGFMFAPAARAADDGVFTTFDTLFMQRDNTANPTALVVNGDTLATAIAADDMQFSVAPGVRLVRGLRRRDDVGWEVGYTGVYGMFADTLATGSGTLEISPPLSSGVASLRDASAARSTYGSTLNSAEVNTLFTTCHVHVPRHTAYEFEGLPRSLTVDWLAGFRWAGLEEQAALAFGTTPATVATGYAVRSSSNLFAGQLGLRGRMTWKGWAVEGWGKAALAGSVLAQSQSPIVDAVTGDVYRTARGSRTDTVGGIFDVGAALVYRINDVWGLRAGYSLLWLTGVALAPDQFDFSTDLDAGTRLDGNATLWLGGGTLGLEARW